MNILIVYDSIKGEIEQIAEIMINKLKAAGNSIINKNIDFLEAKEILDSDLIIIGSPTVYWQPAKKIKDLLKILQKFNIKGKLAASFCAKIHKSLMGNAASKIQKNLSSAGFQIISKPLEVCIDENGNLPNDQIEMINRFSQNVINQLNKIKYQNIPFKIGDYVIGDKFTDREKILKELSININSLKQGTKQDFSILGPLGIGKTSLLIELKKRLKDDFVVIYLDCSKIYPLNEISFLESYSKEIYSQSFKALGIKIFPEEIWKMIKQESEKALERIEEIELEFKEMLNIWIRFRKKQIKLQNLIISSLNLPENFAKKKKTPPYVIILDEFQELYKLDNRFIDYFKALMTSHQDVDYILSSTENHIDKSFILLKLEDKLTYKDAEEFLNRKFKEFKKQPNSIKTILNLSQLSPYYLQWLARAVYLRALDKKLITKESVKNAYKLRLNELTNFFEAKIQNPKLLDILKIIIKNNQKELDLNKFKKIKIKNLINPLNRLVNLGFLIQEDSKYKIKDKVLIDWIKKEL